MSAPRPTTPTAATAATTKLRLPPAQRRLVELMQHINFGRIEALRVQSGQPRFEPPPKIVREIKIGGENGPRTELNRRDFALREQVIELFAHLEELGDGTVISLEVKHGLPFKLAVESSG